MCTPETGWGTQGETGEGGQCAYLRRGGGRQGRQARVGRETLTLWQNMGERLAPRAAALLWCRAVGLGVREPSSHLTTMETQVWLLFLYL